MSLHEIGMYMLMHFCFSDKTVFDNQMIITCNFHFRKIRRRHIQKCDRNIIKKKHLNSFAPPHRRTQNNNNNDIETYTAHTYIIKSNFVDTNVSVQVR